METRRNLCFSLFFFNILTCFVSDNLYVVSAKDSNTISSGQYLTGSQTLVSAEGNFELGFFTPGKSLNYYIGIWYKKISKQTYVWVANRDTPLKEASSSQLKVLTDGNLVVLDKSNTQIWSTNLTGLNRKSKLVLGDDGNLVLSSELNQSDVIWQSFDHPADTWLPGGKINFNKKTDKPTFITSWKNSEDPAHGLYSLSLAEDGSSSYYIKRKGSSEHYWSSGDWDEKSKRFSLVPEMSLNYIYNFSYIDNDDEKYFTYNVYNKSIVSRFIMDVSGQIKQVSWLTNTQAWNVFWVQPRQQCDVEAYCGSFGSCNNDGSPFCKCMQAFAPKVQKDWDLNDFSGGCARNIPLKCGGENAFLPVPNVKVPVNSSQLAVQDNEECKLSCLNSCLCNAYSYGSSRCSVWNGDLLSLQEFKDGNDSSRSDLFVKVDSSAFQTLKNTRNTSSSSSTGLIAGVAAGSIAFLGLLSILIWRFCVTKRKSKTVEGSLIAFMYRDLQSATKNFSDILGGGGFGTVTKGTLPDKTVVAVKRLEGVSQGEKQFRTEVCTIGTIQHVNLVRLRGFCSEGVKRCLVYEYMPMGSLDSQLFHQKDTKVLDWSIRYQIALGTARGLAYLHEKCRDCIIHCDIKPENILLDVEYCPKVADFGLAKLVGRDFSRVLTTMRGTRGYLAPEWISGIAITAKADVYSYGMMLFEIISGRRNSDQSEEGTIKFFPTWVAKKINEGEEVLTLLDKRLNGEADVDELTRACRVACWCIQDDETHRPTMGMVVQILEGILEVNPPPIPRSLHVLMENQENIRFFSETSNSSSGIPSTTSLSSSQTKSSTSSKNS